MNEWAGNPNKGLKLNYNEGSHRGQVKTSEIFISEMRACNNLKLRYDQVGYEKYTPLYIERYSRCAKNVVFCPKT